MDIGKIDKVWEIQPATAPAEAPLTVPETWPGEAPAEPGPDRETAPAKTGGARG